MLECIGCSRTLRSDRRFRRSLSDTGNDYILSGDTSPAPPYYMGRASNGPIWVDSLATKLGVPDPQPSLAGGTNYAYGGFTATSLNQSVPDLTQQVQQYLQKSSQADPNALYTLLTAANDFFGGQTNPAIPETAVKSAASARSSRPAQDDPHLKPPASGKHASDRSRRPRPL